MSYVDRIVEEFGGVRAMAATLGRAASTVQSWKTRGSIPDVNKPEVLNAAELAGLPLAPADFFPTDVTARSSSTPEAAE